MEYKGLDPNWSMRNLSLGRASVVRAQAQRIFSSRFLPCPSHTHPSHFRSRDTTVAFTHFSPGRHLPNDWSDVSHAPFSMMGDHMRTLTIVCSCLPISFQFVEINPFAALLFSLSRPFIGMPWTPLFCTWIFCKPLKRWSVLPFPCWPFLITKVIWLECQFQESEPNWNCHLLDRFLHDVCVKRSQYLDCCLFTFTRLGWEEWFHAYRWVWCLIISEFN